MKPCDMTSDDVTGYYWIWRYMILYDMIHDVRQRDVK